MRLREMEATGAIPLPAEHVAATDGDAAEGYDEASAFSSQVSIDLFDDQGRPRSRRELRELRAKAEAELAAQAEGPAAEPHPHAHAAQEPGAAEPAPSAPVAAEPVPTAAESATLSARESAGVLAFEEPLTETVAFDVLLDQAQAEFEETKAAAAAAQSSAPALDPLDAYLASLGDDGSTHTGGVPTVRPSSQITGASFEEAAFGAVVPSAGVSDSAAEATAVDSLFEALAEPEAAERTLSDSDLFAPPVSAGVAGHNPFVSAAPQAAPIAEPAEESAVPSATAPPASPVPSVEPRPAVQKSPAAEAPAAATQAGAEAQEEQKYSFPDIAPLDEGISVFDDPAMRVMGSSAPAQRPAPTGAGFDDLINRAVAQEGATSSTNTSALILPSFPETDALAGPLGGTGELYITGSIDLPKSLGETGGHSFLHDSVEVEPVDDLGFAESAPTSAIMAPVSASRAVSARVNQGPLVTEASKDKSKLPVVLIATGGVLVVGAVGLIIWAAASGLFG